jgi:hypothetical protein
VSLCSEALAQRRSVDRLARTGQRGYARLVAGVGIGWHVTVALLLCLLRVLGVALAAAARLAPEVVVLIGCLSISHVLLPSIEVRIGRAIARGHPTPCVDRVNPTPSGPS